MRPRGSHVRTTEIRRLHLVFQQGCSLRQASAPGIVAIIARDAPLTTDQGADATGLSFPPAFKHDAGFTPLVGDARPSKDGFRQAWLKVADVSSQSTLPSLRAMKPSRLAAMWIVTRE